MSRLRVLLTAVAAMGLILGVAGMASASTIGCGQCHGVFVNNSTAGVSTRGGSVSHDLRNTGQAAPYENELLPQSDNYRGLHGIHMNYSSISFPTGLYGTYSSGSWVPKPQTNTVTGPYAGTYGQRGVCEECHAADHPNHESGFLQWSTTSVIGSAPNNQYEKYNNFGWPATKGYMRFSSIAGGTSDKGNVASMGITTNANGVSGYCTKACHKGTSVSNPAPWGNYTSASIVLSCSSCHGDASNNGATNANAQVTGYSLSAPLNYGHKIHLNSYSTADDWTAGGVKIVLGNNSGILYDRASAAGGNTDKACLFCHPAPIDAVTGLPTEGKTKLDWGPGGLNTNQGKAYPHAVDGTNVVTANAVKNNQIGGMASVTLANTTGNDLGATCSSACHTNPLAGSLYETSNPGWNGKFATGGGCDLCHNHQFSASANEAAGRSLSYAHTLHFLNLSASGNHGSPACSAGAVSNGYGITTGGCHNANKSNTSGLTAIPLHVNIVGAATGSTTPNLYEIPVANGSAGLDPSMNPKFIYGNTTTATPTGPTTGVTCQNSCHTTRSPRWDSIVTNGTQAALGCNLCHEYPSVAPGGAGTWASTNGHSVEAPFNEASTVTIQAAGGNTAGALKHLSASWSYNYATDTFAGVTNDVTKCGKCHYGATHGLGHGADNAFLTYSMVNPYSGSDTRIQAKAASGFTLVNHTFGSSAQCSNAKCHFNRTTPNWY